MAEPGPAAVAGPLGREAILRPAPGVRFRELGGEAVLLDLDRGLYLSLNATGTAVWLGLVAGRPLGAIHADLLARFEVADDVLWADLVALCHDLVARGLALSVGAPDC